MAEAAETSVVVEDLGVEIEVAEDLEEETEAEGALEEAEEVDQEMPLKQPTEAVL